MGYTAMNKITRLIFYVIITAAIAYLRLAFPGRSLIENDAVLYTEIIKRFHGINPFSQFTFKWSPIFLTGYYGWVLPDLRAIVYFFLPFLKVQFYLTANPDVSAIGMNPLDHYLQFGWREGRDPSESFSTSSYLDANPDVELAGVNPLLHYLMFGYGEGRLLA